MKNQEINEQVRGELPKNGLGEKHLEQTPIYMTYNEGSRQVSPNAMALYEDGVIYRYSDKQYKFEDGQMLSLDVPLEWRVEGEIGGESVEEIKRLLDDFTETQSNSRSSQSPLEVNIMRKDTVLKIRIEGEEKEENYKIFSKVNDLISIGLLKNK